MEISTISEVVIAVTAYVVSLVFVWFWVQDRTERKQTELIARLREDLYQEHERVLAMQGVASKIHLIHEDCVVIRRLAETLRDDVRQIESIQTIDNMLAGR